MSQIILTEDQKKELEAIPYNISDETLMTYCAFDEEDRRLITERHREYYNKIGFAVQLFHIRYLGWAYDHTTRVPSKVLDFISLQLGLNKPREWNLKANYKRRNTLSEHFKEICAWYGYKQVDEESEKQIKGLISNNADVVENREYIIRGIIDSMKKAKVILPKISTIEKWVLEACNKKEKDLNRLIYSMLSDRQKADLRDIIRESGDSEGKRFSLFQLRNVSGDVTPDTFKQIAERIAYIDSVGIDIDLSFINNNMRQAIARKISNRRKSSIERIHEEKIMPSVVIYLHVTRKRLVDLAVEVNDGILKQVLKKGKKRQERSFLADGKKIIANQRELLDVLETVYKAISNKKNVKNALSKKLSMEELEQLLKEGRAMNNPSNEGLDNIDAYYTYLRQYFPILLDVIKVESTSDESKDLKKALELLRDKEKHGTHIHSDAPMGHIDTKWSGFVKKMDIIDQHYYEIATIDSLRNAIRNNSLTVVGSDKYMSFEDDLVTRSDYLKADDIFDEIRAFGRFEDYISNRKNMLMDMLKLLSESLSSSDGIWIKDGKLHISPLDAAVPAEGVELSRKIFKTMVPEARLEEVLLEVDKWTGFSKQFIHKNLRNQSVKDSETERIMAALTAIGTNVGLTKMSQATGKCTYSQLLSTVQNCMDDDNLVKAQREIIKTHRNLWVSEYWGEGNTSSSDGRGIRNTVSSFNAEPNPRHGIENGCTIYRFVNDKYYTFHTKVISSSKEYQHVIDGVLSHELMTGEPVLEHYTDTGGYTDCLFALADLLGFAYAPRIKNASDRILYIFKDTEVSDDLKSIDFKHINIEKIRNRYDDILRLAYSIKKGKVTGALVMRKLCNKSSELRKALVEMGRIERSIFLLRYFTSKELRRRIEIGLNKGEANNMLAKAVQFGREGKFSTKDIESQQVRASALSLIMDAISLWNAVYLQKSVEYMESRGEYVNRSLLKHVSPQNYEHITFLGHYDFNPKLSLGEGEYRKLKVE